jgi:pyridoxal phosphate enzyme (YggS family)
MDIPARLAEVRDRMSQACARAGRSADSVRLIAVSKTRTAEEITSAVRAGIVDVGENRVQEAEVKQPRVEGRVRWHLIGHLQKNKARKAIELFDCIHSVDGVELGRRLDRLSAEMGKRPVALLQVDLAGEATKHGIPESDLLSALEDLGQLENLRIEGFMILPPYFEESERVRPYFQKLRELSDEARRRGLLHGEELSMGMSHDFEVAIEEGATMIRVGTALFGPRPSIAKTPIGETK